MARRTLAGVLVGLLLFLAACAPETLPPFERVVPLIPAESNPLTATALVISEVQVGLVGDSNAEFVELYNPTALVLDLLGYRLVHRFATGGQDKLVYTWSESALVPAYGHYLLVRSGSEDVIAVRPDGIFDQPLGVSRGGLALLTPEGATADSVGWGNGPQGMIEGKPAPIPESGTSIERLPGGEKGNLTDSGDNGADFAINMDPNPQNVESPPAPSERKGFSIALSAPSKVEPGMRFDYELVVANNTGVATHDVLIAFRVPVGLTVLAAPDGALVTDNLVQWVLAEMAGGTTVSRRVTVEAPTAYATFIAQDYGVRAGDWPQQAVGAPIRTQVHGGIVAVTAARSLIGEPVTLEGLVTMNVSGCWDGMHGTGFYLQDNTGGIRVCWSDHIDSPSWADQVVPGVSVRVTGEVVARLGSVQIMPASDQAGLVILGREPLASPREVAVEQARDDPTLEGLLIGVMGQAIRVEEFTEHYEIDLVDNQGSLLLVMVDKLEGVELQTERIGVGNRYSVAGVSEVYGGTGYVRLQSPDDISEVPEPVLAVAADAPNLARYGETIEYTFNVYNHTDAPFTGVTLTSTVPAGNAILAAIEDGGELVSDTVHWSIPVLLPRERQGVHFSVVVTGHITAGVDTIAIERYAAWANEWPLHETGLPVRTFISDSIPIYAIQGPGFASPYVLDKVDVEGVVTGVFPGLNGFWMQGLSSDGDPFTSEGLFVAMDGMHPVSELYPKMADLVKVHGYVRERWNQTELHVTSPRDLAVVDHGQTLPDPVELDPPLGTEAAAAYYEPLEGMLVSVTDPAIGVGPTAENGRYGLVRPEHGVERVLPGQETGLLILVDDGTDAWHKDRTTLSYTVRTGDRVGGLLGPLAVVDGNYAIEPVEPPTLRPGPGPLAPQLPLLDTNEFSIATFNVGSFLDGRMEHSPSDPSALGFGEYEHKRDQIVETIQALGAPIIVGFQEIENATVLGDIAAQPELAVYDYQTAAVVGNDERDRRDTDVGFLVRGDRATLVRAARYQTPIPLFGHPPLMITVTVSLGDAGRSARSVTVYAIVNHFTSWIGNGPLSESHRVEEARWNAQLVDDLLVYDPEAYVAVLGTLGRDLQSASMQALTRGGIPGGRLVNVTEVLPAAERYSTVSQGVSYMLDHILVTPALAARQVRVAVLHVNADYPPVDRAGGSLHRSSSHDPVVTIFKVAE